MNYLEKKWIYIAAVVIAAALIYQWGLAPALSHRSELQKQQENARQRLQKLKQLQKKYLQAQKGNGKSETLGKKDRDFTLFSYLESQASQNNIKNNIEFMRPSSNKLSSGLLEKQVELRIGNVSLSNMVKFLEQIEYAPEGIFIKRATIRSPRKDPGNLQVNMVIVTYR